MPFCNKSVKRIIFTIFFCVHIVSGEHEVIYAKNAGSPTATTDSLGIRYEADTTEGSVPCGRSASLSKMPIGDKSLYEHIQHGNFGYGFNFHGDGYYTIVLKFSDCWDAQINQRTFNVLLNQRTVITELDIAKEGGLNTVYLENIRFTVCGGKLYLHDNQHVPGFNQYVRLDFAQIPDRWGPIVNALVVLKQTRIDEELPEVLRPTKKTNLPFYECKIPTQIGSKVEAVTDGQYGHGKNYIFNIYGPITLNIFQGTNRTQEDVVNTELK